MKLAISWQVKVTGDTRSIELLDVNGNIITGDARWEGNFYCNDNQLTSLVGAPKEVGGGFYCGNNKLTSLAGAPKEVGGDFDCYNNKLTSLAGAPEEVDGDFYCYNNKLTSLVGAPKEVGGCFNCNNNKLTSLEGAPKENSPDVATRLFISGAAKGYLYYNNLKHKILSQEKIDSYMLYKTEAVVALFDGETISYGDTVVEVTMNCFEKGRLK